jgi:hypothetical protein
MNDPWVRLQQAAGNSLDWIWNVFAKDGRETAVLAKVAQSPKASGWLVGCMSAADDDITRKIGAMLAGLIHDEEQTQLLPELLQSERDRFPLDPLGANSVTEDVLFAAVRWTTYGGKCQETGIDVLANIVRDALETTEWNTAQWAAASLHAATGGKHPVIDTLTDETTTVPASLQIVAEAIRLKDNERLAQLTVTPNPIVDFPADVTDSHLAAELWAAIREAEVEALKP